MTPSSGAIKSVPSYYFPPPGSPHILDSRGKRTPTPTMKSGTIVTFLDNEFKGHRYIHEVIGLNGMELITEPVGDPSRIYAWVKNPNGTFQNMWCACVWEVENEYLTLWDDEFRGDVSLNPILELGLLSL